MADLSVRLTETNPAHEVLRKPQLMETIARQGVMHGDYNAADLIDFSAANPDVTPNILCRK